MVESDVPSPELPYAEDPEVNHMTQHILTLSPSRTRTSRMQHASATVLQLGTSTRAGLGLGSRTGALRLAIFRFCSSDVVETPVMEISESSCQ